MTIYNPDSPLDKAPGESKRAVAAFNDYALMGATRSYRALLAVYKRQAQKPPTKSWNTLTVWATRFAWVERAARFDDLQRKKAQEAYEAHWKEKIMVGVEVLGRLSEQARVSIADFIEQRTEPILDKNGNPTGAFTESVSLNWTAIKEKGHLIKSITSTLYGPKIELHDGQAALLSVGKHLRLFTDFMMNIDMRALTDEQLERVLSGEDPLAVVFSGNKGAGREGTPSASSDPEPGAE